MRLRIQPAASRTRNASSLCRLLACVALLLVAPLALVSPAQAQVPSQPTTPMPSAPSVAAPPVPTEPNALKATVAGTDAPPTLITPPKLPGMAAAQGSEVDRVVAIVNGELVLDSDVDQERRFSALLPYGEASGTYTREKALERLINRDLILQQVKLQPLDPISDADVAKDLDGIRKVLPNCKEYHCETKAGWDKFLATQGFTEATLDGLWRQRMIVLQFIEQRFRMGIKIPDTDIQTYYTQELLPQYAKLNAPAPPLTAISSRIQEILLQQHVSALLSDWLQSLRAQGNVILLHPGEETP